jgi:flagellar biosynthesis protein FlhB
MPASERTEKPTPKRLEDARKKGDSARSAAVAAVAAVVALLMCVSFRGDSFTARFYALLAGSVWTGGERASLDSFRLFAVELAVFPALTAAVVIAATLMQTGSALSSHRLLNPAVVSVSRLFSGENIRTALFSLIANLALGSLTAWIALGASARAMAALSAFPGVPGALEAVAVKVGRRAGLLAICAGAVLATVDYWLKRRARTKRLMMTRDEVRQEQRESEGDPFIKARRKRLHRQMAMNPLGESVRKSRVLVLNPTHVAVALRYEDGDEAPVVSYKGEGKVAQKMREHAEAAGVPMVRDIMLARAMYNTLEIEDEIPPELYEAVAAVFHAAARAAEDGVSVVCMD